MGGCIGVWGVCVCVCVWGGGGYSYMHMNHMHEVIKFSWEACMCLQTDKKAELFFLSICGSMRGRIFHSLHNVKSKSVPLLVTIMTDPHIEVCALT